jgi:vacuolar-type H+-ATPase subunit I/STV1
LLASIFQSMQTSANTIIIFCFDFGPEPLCEETAHRRQSRIDNLGNALYMMILSIMFGAPLICLSLFFGYWAVVSYLTMGLCGLAVTVLLLTNTWWRLVRAWTVLTTLHTASKQKAECTDAHVFRASYIAICGFDSGKDIVKTLSLLCLVISFWMIFVPLVMPGVTRDIVSI